MSSPPPVSSSSGVSPNLSLAGHEPAAAWFTDQVHAHDAQLKSYLRRTFPSVRDVEDVVQESYLRVWRRNLERPIESAKSFLFQVARNLASNAARRDRTSPIEQVSDFDHLRVVEDKVGLAEAVCARQEIACLLEAIETLPRRCREIVLLRKIQGLSQKEIAARLGLSEQTVQVQACRGLKRLQRIMRERGIIDGP